MSRFDKKEWKLTTSGGDNVRLFGLDIFKHKWHGTGEYVKIQYPVFDEEKTLEVKWVRVLFIKRYFVATEVSNTIFVFFT
ncbi:MAG: hypothetical protein K6F93_05720 [Lachnospiraceae bacterium]|nr:hypothetical protein [Lachnospiraceae bacterium]